MFRTNVPGARGLPPIVSLAASLLAASVIPAGCGLHTAAQNHLQTSIVSQGNFALEVESQLTTDGIEGIVLASGCAEFEDPFANDPFFQSQDTTVQNSAHGALKDTQPIAEPEPICSEFGPSNVLVRIAVGSQEITTRTDSGGRFRVSSGDQLALLTSAGNSAQVIATLSGVSATTTLNLSQLDDVAALAVLDEMVNPSVSDITSFLTRWAGTPAGELALVRHRDVVCGQFQHDWNEMMVTGDIARLDAFADRYDAPWQGLYCDTCTAECGALGGLSDLSSELEMAGAR